MPGSCEAVQQMFLISKRPNLPHQHGNVLPVCEEWRPGSVAVHDIDKRRSLTVERRGVTTGGISSAVAGAIRLNNLSDDDVSALRSFLHRKRFSPGEIIINQGDPGDGH